MKYILFFFIAAAFAACSSGNSTDKRTELANLKKEQAALQQKIDRLEAELSANDTSAAMKEISVTVAEPDTFVHYVEVQAKVDADENVALSPQVPGTVTKVYVEPGDEVKKGQVLAELDAGVLSASMDEAQTRLDFARTTYERQKSLWEQKVGTEMQFLEARTRYESASKGMASLREQYAMTRIKSPINGTVDAVNLKIGQAVNPGPPVIRVVNLKGLKVKAEVAEAYVSKINDGDAVLVEFPDIKQNITAKLSYSGKVIDPLNRTFGVEADLTDKQKDLHPNMVAVLKIADYSNPAAFIVPVNVLQNSESGQYLYVAEQKKNRYVAARRTVTAGQSYNGMVEITSGLKAGDRVITTGYQELIEGQPVKF
jgi:membrane fusion protein, multidrug efflux system